MVSWPGAHLVLAVVLGAGSWGCSSHESGALQEVSDLVPMGGEMKEEVKGKEEIDRLYVFPQSFFYDF